VKEHSSVWPEVEGGRWKFEVEEEKEKRETTDLFIP
jgi:hypothetical protein